MPKVISPYDEDFKKQAVDLLLSSQKPISHVARELAIKERACEILKKLSPRPQSALSDEGIHCGKNRIKRLMKAAGIRPKQKRKFRPTTTLSDPSHRNRIASNHLAKFPAPDRPDQAWQSDI